MAYANPKSNSKTRDISIAHSGNLVEAGTHFNRTASTFDSIENQRFLSIRARPQPIAAVSRSFIEFIMKSITFWDFTRPITIPVIALPLAETICIMLGFRITSLKAFFFLLKM